MAEVAGTHMVLSNPVLEFESITQVKKFRFFSVIHHQTSRIIKYSSGYNHKQGFSIPSAFRKYNAHSGWWRRGWTFLNPRPDVDHQWQFCTSGGNHLVFVCWIIVELWSRQESESINMVDAVNIFENLYQIIKFQIKLKYNVNRVIHTSNNFDIALLVLSLLLLRTCWWWKFFLIVKVWCRSTH